MASVTSSRRVRPPTAARAWGSMRWRPQSLSGPACPQAPQREVQPPVGAAVLGEPVAEVPQHAGIVRRQSEGALEVDPAAHGPGRALRVREVVQDCSTRTAAS
jgi:hypothetical protein